jgi:dissimilatory sulfite reductase (desulfoviridin) alpha/beta subunit
MAVQNIDYDALKKRGFLRQKQDGFFVLRTKMPYGVFEAKHIAKLIQISCEYAQGFIHTTVRQGIEIPFIKFESVDKVEQELKVAGIETGTSGSRLRTTTCCPGNNWCKSGLINTFALYKRIEEELNIRCGIDLPHKFKIAISGCPNGCTRSQNSEIGIHGQLDLASPDKRIGYTVYLAGCSGRTPRLGFKLNKVFSEEEVLEVVKKTVAFFKTRAKSRQRLALLVEEIGKENFLRQVGF